MEKYHSFWKSPEKSEVEIKIGIVNLQITVEMARMDKMVQEERIKWKEESVHYGEQAEKRTWLRRQKKSELGNRAETVLHPKSQEKKSSGRNWSVSVLRCKAVRYEKDRDIFLNLAVLWHCSYYVEAEARQQWLEEKDFFLKWRHCYVDDSFIKLFITNEKTEKVMSGRV